MNKDKLNSLVKYASQLKDKLEAPTPSKHLHRPEAYKRFLKHEIAIAERKIESLKLVATK